MSQQPEAIAPAQAYSFATAHELLHTYLSMEDHGITPNAYIVDGDMTTTYTA